MSEKFKECIDCGNQLSYMAEMCGNTKCNSSDPFGKKRRARKINRIIGLLLVVGACVTFYYKVGNPIDIIRDPQRLLRVQ